MADNLPSGSEFRAARADSTASSSSTGSASGNAASSTGHNVTNMLHNAAHNPGATVTSAAQHARESVAQHTPSMSSTTTSSSPPGSGAGSGSPSSPSRRRPSHSLFETLQAQKRKDDPASLARRQSLNEQRPTAGFLGSMWNRFVLSLSFSLSPYPTLYLSDPLRPSFPLWGPSRRELSFHSPTYPPPCVS